MRGGQFLIGVDLGGTKTIVALIDEASHIIGEAKRPTPLNSSRAVVETVKELIDDLLLSNHLTPSDLMGIGLGIAGMINFKEGMVVFSPNLPLRDVPFRNLIQEYYKVPTFLDNDANTATLGEKYYGAGRHVSNMVCITLGTGIGGGIIVDNKLYRGTTGSAAEIGHMVIDINGPECTCGSFGCFEALASGRVISKMASQAIEEIEEGESPAILRLADEKIENIRGETVARAAQEGDLLAKEIFGNIGRVIGIGLVNVVNIFNPELVVLAGGIAQAGELILSPAREVVLKQALIPNSQVVEIVLTELKDKASVIGAAALAFHEINL